jgi:tetratricopeptide (TPR) repeat protein
MTMSDVSAAAARPLRRPADSRADFVGRKAELAVLRAALEDACAGQKRIVLVAGEPGIGKTRLAQELAAIAVERDVQVLWGRCWESGDGVAFWPWVQIIREYARTQRTASLRAGAGAAIVTQVVAGIRDCIPNLPLPPLLPPEQARFRLFDTLATFLTTAAARKPLALIVDDLHRADPLSLLFLQFLAREVRPTPILVLGTYRDTDLQHEPALATMLGDGAREARQIELQHLSTGEVAELVERASGMSPTPQFAAAVRERSDGNPFYVTELINLLLADNGLRLTAEAVRHARVPRGVRQTIRLRTDQLSVECRRLLRIAAVVGREFDIKLLEKVSVQADSARDGALQNVRLPQLFDEARNARMIDEVPGSPGSLRFSHALIRDSLYEELQVTERAELHRLVARAIERGAGQTDDVLAAVLAYHFFQAIPAGTAEEAVTYASKAGDRSAAMLAYEDSARHYATALRAHDAFQRTPGANGPRLEAQRCDLLIALGQAQVNAGDRSAAGDTLTKAATVARRLGDGERLARAALALFGEWSPDIDERTAAFLGEALERLATDDSSLRARVLSRLATALYNGGPPERRQALSSEAVAIADRLGDPQTLAFALGNAHYSLQGPDYLRQRLDVATRMLAQAEAANSQERMLEAHSCRFRDLLQLGDIAAADIALHHYCRIAEALRQPYNLHRATVMRSMRALLEGRFEHAEQLAQEGLATGQRAQSTNAMLTFAAQMWTLRRDQGRLHELEDIVRTFVEQDATVPAARTALALLYAEIERTADARVEFERLAAHDFADIPRDVNYLNTIDMLAQTCAHLGDTARAARLYELLLPYAPQVAVVAFADACHGAVARSLGLLAVTLDRWRPAAQHFEEGLAINARLGARPYLARSQHQYAEMLLRDRGRPTRIVEREPDKAFALLDQAIATYEQLGMPRCLQQAIELRARVGGSRGAAAEAPPNVFRFDGQRWTVRWQGRAVPVRKASALHYIAHLLRNLGREVHLVDLQLAAGSVATSRPESAYGAMSRRQLAAENLSILMAGEGERVFDARALAQFYRCLRELRDERENAGRCNDAGRLAAIDGQIEELERALRGRAPRPSIPPFHLSSACRRVVT